MSTCLIIGAAPCADPSYLMTLHKQSDYVICADGGIDTAKQVGIACDFWIGDGDSCEKEFDVQESSRLPREKDETDLYCAVQHALEHGAKTIYIAAATGGRGDHFLANLSLLEFLFEENVYAEVVDECNRFLFHSGGERKLSRDPDFPYVSIVPLDRELIGVTLKGLKYPLKDAILQRKQIISVSNEAVCDEFTVRIETGRALIVYSKDVKR
ncbi:MAG: thiamine diphosphokinase [Ruminococcaceae bacterium]|nr:thiamine diphosphokinase [Oscillospiraceae bacterium]